MYFNKQSDRLQIALIVTQLHAMAQRRAAHDARQGIAGHMLDVLEDLNDAAVVAADAVQIDGAPSPAPIH